MATQRAPTRSRSRSSRARCRRSATRCSPRIRKTAMSAIIYEVLDMGTGDHRRATATSPRPAPASPAFVGVLDKAVKRMHRAATAPGDDPARRHLRHQRPVLRRRHAPERRRARDAGVRRRRADRLDGEHRPLERRRRHGARLDLERGARDLPGGPAASGGQAVAGGRADRVGAGDHEGQQPAARLPARATCGPGSRPSVSASGGILELVERYGVDTFLAALDALHGLRRAGRAARAARTCRRARSRSRRSRTAAQVYTRHGRDHRRRVRRRPARQPRPGRRAEQRLARRRARSPRRWCS